MTVLLVKSHIRNQKMRLWDTPAPLLILCSQRCFLKPLGALTSPLYRGPCYRLCAHPVSPPCPSNEAVRLRVCGGYRMWTHKSPGRVRSGDLDGAGHPPELWVCHTSSCAHSVKCSQALCARGRDLEEGVSSKLQDPVRGLSISACPACFHSECQFVM